MQKNWKGYVTFFAKKKKKTEKKEASFFEND